MNFDQIYDLEVELAPSEDHNYSMVCDIVEEYHIHPQQIELHMIYELIPAVNYERLWVMLYVFRELQYARNEEDYSVISLDEIVSRLDTYTDILHTIQDEIFPDDDDEEEEEIDSYTNSTIHRNFIRRWQRDEEDEYLVSQTYLIPPTPPYMVVRTH